MSITRRCLPFLAASLILFAGCRSHKEIAKTPEPDTTVAQQQTATTPTTTPTTPAKPTTANKPTYTPHYYSGNFDCTAMGYKAKGQLRLQSDSVIWACATKVVELARAKMTPDSVIIYVKLMNRCFKGTYDDFYKRYHYRTNFKTMYKMVTAKDANAQITALAKKLGTEISLTMDPLKEVETLNFPMVIPNKVNPL